MTKPEDTALLPTALCLSEGLGPNAALLDRLRSTAHWQLIEGNGDDATHQALQAAIAEIERLREALKKANDQAEHFERAWYLRGDVLETLAEASDAAGVANFDSDTLSDEVQAMQDATTAARLDLGLSSCSAARSLISNRPDSTA